MLLTVSAAHGEMLWNGAESRGCVTALLNAAQKSGGGKGRSPVDGAAAAASAGTVRSLILRQSFRLLRFSRPPDRSGLTWFRGSTSRSSA